MVFVTVGGFAHHYADLGFIQIAHIPYQFRKLDRVAPDDVL